MCMSFGYVLKPSEPTDVSGRELKAFFGLTVLGKSLANFRLVQTGYLYLSQAECTGNMMTFVQLTKHWSCGMPLVLVNLQFKPRDFNLNNYIFIYIMYIIYVYIYIPLK